MTNPLADGFPRRIQYMKFAGVERRWLRGLSFPLERDTLVKPPGLCPRLRFPPEKEMQRNSREKKQKEQEAYRTPALPRIYPTCDCKQNAVFDNTKPARLRMQGDVFFLPVEFFEGHISPTKYRKRRASFMSNPTRTIPIPPLLHILVSV
jgi:hypothetical protein